MNELYQSYLHCRLLAESLGYKEDSTDCTVPCTPPRTEEDIYNSLDTDFFPKKESNPLLKEILFKEEPCFSSSSSNSSSISSPASTISSSVSSPASVEFERSPLRELLFKGSQKDLAEETSAILKIEKIQEDLIQEKLPNPLQREEELFSDGRKSDHQLLREVLRDTSFQRKYNLRPVDLAGLGIGFVNEMETGDCVGDLTREQIEPVLSLAIQQLQKDFDNTCVALGIHPGEYLTMIIV